MKVNAIQSYRYNASNNQNMKNNVPAFKSLQLPYKKYEEEIMSKLSEEGKRVLKEAMEAEYNLKELCGYDKDLHRIGKEAIDIILKIQNNDKELQKTPNDTVVMWLRNTLYLAPNWYSYGLVKSTSELDDADGCFKKEDCYLDGEIYVPTKTAVENFLIRKINQNVAGHRKFEEALGQHWLS